MIAFKLEYCEGASSLVPAGAGFVEQVDGPVSCSRSGGRNGEIDGSFAPSPIAKRWHFESWASRPGYVDRLLRRVVCLYRLKVASRAVSPQISPTRFGGSADDV